MSAARRLYRERGFERVTVAAIAEEAGVAPRTLFSYFETKEDVFIGAGDDRLERLVHAIRGRQEGEPILSAAQRELLRAPASRSRSERPELADLLSQPAIQARLRERWNRWEDVLAECIADTVKAGAGDPAPKVVAAAITAAIRVAASSAPANRRRRAAVAERVFGLLASGMANYGAEKQ